MTRCTGRRGYFEGTGEEFNISYMPILPFCTMLIGKKLVNDDRGRGESGLYLGPSMLVRGGIIMLSLVTGALSIKYSFVARSQMPLLKDIDVKKSTELMYGKLVQTIEVLPQFHSLIRHPLYFHELIPVPLLFLDVLLYSLAHLQ